MAVRPGSKVGVMLRNSKKYSKIILIGSTSEIGLGILKAIPLDRNARITLVGRVRPDHFIEDNWIDKIEFHYSDLENAESLDFLVEKIETLGEIELAVIAAGYLPPENLEGNQHEVRKAMKINALAVPTILSALAFHMSTQESGEILLISSVASIRPRPRNFTYGASKSCADFFALGYSLKNRKKGLLISILRLGFVYTRMTSNFNPAPFATTVEKVADDAVRGLRRRRRIIYSPNILKYVMGVARFIPRTLFDRLG